MKKSNDSFILSWSTSRLQGRDGDRGLIRKLPDFSVINCYTTEQNTDEGVMDNRSIEDFISGYVAFHINRRAAAYIWYQTLGQDSFPTLSPESKTVYATIVHNGQDVLSTTCSNDPADQQVIVDHQ